MPSSSIFLIKSGFGIARRRLGEMCWVTEIASRLSASPPRISGSRRLSSSSASSSFWSA